MRHLDWDGCFNVRDLGGLPGADGRRTRWGALVRADALDGLSEAGWEALAEHGVRTVIDLRNDDERQPDAAPRPRSLTTLRIQVDVAEDREFWSVWRHGPQFGTPLYYRPHIERFPERSAAVLAAIVDAPPGGVAFHCAGGRDRAGQIALHLVRSTREGGVQVAGGPQCRGGVESDRYAITNRPTRPSRSATSCIVGCAARTG